MCALCSAAFWGAWSQVPRRRQCGQSSMAQTKGDGEVKEEERKGRAALSAAGTCCRRLGATRLRRRAVRSAPTGGGCSLRNYRNPPETPSGTTRIHTHAHDWALLLCVTQEGEDTRSTIWLMARKPLIWGWVTPRLVLLLPTYYASRCEIILLYTYYIRSNVTNWYNILFNKITYCYTHATLCIINSLSTSKQIKKYRPSCLLTLKHCISTVRFIINKIIWSFYCTHFTILHWDFFTRQYFMWWMKS